MLPIVLFAVTGAACAQELDISATLEARYAYGIESGESQSAELEFRPVWELTLSDQWSFQGGIRLRTDAYDRLELGQPEQEVIDPLSRRFLMGQATEVELREAYFQYSGDLTTVRFGKQQIVWGRADGIKVLDVVNPQSFREFILDDFDQSRTPLWSLMVERTMFGLDVQGFWLFDQTFNEAPPRGSIFEVTAPEFVPTFFALPSVPVVLEDIDRPKDRFGASEFGVQVSGLIGNWDFSLNYLYTYEDNPFYDLDMLPNQISITQELNRVNIVGGSFANSWGDVTLRGEATYTYNENIPFGFYPNVATQPAESDVVKYVVGLDYVGVPETFLSVQFFQQIKLDEIPNALVPRVEEFTTFLVRHNFSDDRWTLEAQWYANHDSKDGLIRSRFTYQINDQFKASLGGDFFYGRETGVFGQFSKTDRVSLTFSYIY
jgi:hypothetical protein